MSIEVMKQALEALQQTTLEDRLVQIGPLDWEYQGTLAVNALRRAIAEAEKQEPTDRQLLQQVLRFLQQVIAYSNEEMARLDELKKLVRDRLAR